MSNPIERLRDIVATAKELGSGGSEMQDDILWACDEIERLRAALAESCDENRTVVLEEGPFSTDMCPLASKQQAEIERLAAELQIANDFAARTVTRTDILKLEAENAKLQAVVDAFTDKLIKLPAKDRWELEELIAALES